MIDYSEAGKRFASQAELLGCFAEILDLHIYYHYKYHFWVSPDSNIQSMLGVVVTREEFEKNLLKTSDSRIFPGLTDEEREEIAMMRNFFFGRVMATPESCGFPVFNMEVAFGKDRFEFLTMLTLLCCEINRRYEKLFAYLQDDISKKRPTADTMIRLWGEPGSLVSGYYRYFSAQNTLMKYICEPSAGSLCTMQLKLSEPVVGFLTGGGADHEFFRATDDLPPVLIMSDLLEKAVCAMGRSLDGKAAVICMCGERGSGRRTMVKHAAKMCGENILFLPAAEIAAAQSAAAVFRRAVCEAVPRGAAICITDFGQLLEEDCRAKLAELSAELSDSGRQFGPHIFITTEQRWQSGIPGEGTILLTLELPETDEDQRLILWERFLKGITLTGEISPAEMAAKFRFNIGQIRGAVDRACELAAASGGGISPELLHECCYAQVVVGLNTLASPIKPAYSWEDLVLPESEIRLLKSACMHVRYRHKVYTEWGFSKKAAYGRGLSVLFSGPPGTGKTMAAQVITNQLHMQLFKVQLSQVVSKYIGETEKNLRRVFTEAKNANCVLFFDETDALFGKRSEVKDSHDRHANIETAYLLQQMEEYDGVVLMATNLLQNIDEAFMRRISFVISFPFPDAPTRKTLWRKMLDARAPLDEIDWDFLAGNFKMAGGNIKNCIIHAAFLAASEDKPIGMRHLLTGIVNEQRKNNTVVLRDDLKQYADLVFGAD
jgi:hypothetical protein